MGLNVQSMYTSAPYPWVSLLLLLLLNDLIFITSLANAMWGRKSMMDFAAIIPWTYTLWTMLNHV
jgi:hypothetical protein